MHVTYEEIDFLNKIKSDSFIPRVVISDAGFTINDYLDRECFKLQGNNSEHKYNENQKLVNYGNQQIELDQSPHAEEHLENQYLRIDINKLLQSYLVNFIKLYYQEATEKFPHNADLKLQFANFSLQHLRSTYTCMNIIRNFKFSGMGFVDKANIKMNELYLVFQLESNMKSKSSYENGFQYQRYGVLEDEQNIKKKSIGDILGEDQLDADHFILINILQFQFTSTIQKLSQEILQFWRLVQAKNFEVQQLISQGKIVAENIGLTYSVFQKIENAVKQKDYKIYYNFAIIQKQLLNDHSAHDLYITKMKSVIAMQKLLKNNYSKLNSDLDIGILFVNGSSEEFGKILFVNQLLQKTLGYGLQDFKHQRITMIMPKIVKYWHNQFVKDFQQTGATKKLNHNVNLFLLKKNGYITPFQLNIQYHYSMSYGHTFIAFANQIREVPLQKNGQPQNVNDVMFFLCDTEETRICDITESCLQILGLDINHINTSDFVNAERTNLTMKELCPAIDLLNLQKFQKEFNHGEQNKIYEGIVELNLEVVKNLRNYSRKDFIVRKIVNALCIVIQESYGKGQHGMNIVCLQILNDNSVVFTNKKGEPTFNYDKIDTNENDQNQESEKIMSGTGSSNSGSSNSSHLTEQLKQSVSSMEKVTPRSLKIVVQLIILVFCIMISISSINLYIVHERQTSLAGELNAVQFCYERITITAKARVILRTLTNVASGFEEQNTTFIGDRFNIVQIALETQIADLIQTQNNLENIVFDYSDSFGKFIRDSNVQMEYLDEKNNNYTQNQTMTFLIRLYISQLVELQSMKLSEAKGNGLPLLNFGIRKPNYSPTLAERTIYFLSQNAQNSIRYMNQQYIEKYARETNQHAEDNNKATIITIMISITAIMIVGAIVAPLISNIQDRQYVAMGFFINIPQLSVDQIVNKITICCNLLTQANKTNPLKKQKKHQSQIRNNENDYSEDNADASANERSPDARQKNPQGSVYFTDTSQIQNLTKIFDQLASVGTNPQSQFYLQPSFQHQLKEDNKMIRYAGREKNYRINDDDEEDEEVSQQHKQDGKDHKEDQNSSEQQQKEEIQSRNLILKKFQKNQKIKIMVKMIGFIIVLSSYYGISYFMAQRIYNSVPITIDALSIIFFKDACIENVISYIRENIMTNSTLTLYEDKNIDAVNYFITKCYQNEQDYREMRKAIPKPLQGISYFFDEVEEDQICKMAFPTIPSYEEWCRKQYYGLVQKGLSNYYQIILNNLQGLDLKFRSNPRNLTNLKALISNEETAMLIEMKRFIFDKVCKIFAQKATDSVDEYFENLMTDYWILYGCFLSLLVIMVLYFVTTIFQQLKLHMWKTNITLKMFPIEYLDSKQHKSLKNFFQ